MKTLKEMTYEELQLELEDCIYSEITAKYNKGRRFSKTAKKKAMEELVARGIDAGELADSIYNSIKKSLKADSSEDACCDSIRATCGQGKTRIMYIELKSGFGDSGPARIGRVTFSKSGRTIYYQGKAFQSLKGSGISGNYFDVDTGEEYWISGPKKDRGDRHWAGSGAVEIDDDVREEYFQKILNKSKRNER
jgi:hypothetical protein